MSEHSGYPGAPPGWYPDPAGGPAQRWWDGYAWNEATVQPAPPAPGGTEPPPPWAVASARLATVNTSWWVSNELSMVRLARVAVAMPGVYYLAGLISEQVNAGRLHTVGHQLRIIYDDNRAGRPAPRLTDSSSFEPISVIIGLLTIAAVVVACVWQHRAASAARSLGLRSTHSPGWGVGSWFVPVVNLWMPYQAIRDCLPAGHPDRPLVLRWWLLLMGAWTTALVAEITIFFSRGLALAFAIPAALCAVGLLATAPRLVASIAAVHRSLLAEENSTAVAGSPAEFQ